MRYTAYLSSTLHDFREKSYAIHRGYFKWYAFREEMHVAPVAILRVILDTTCAVAYYVIDVSGYIEPKEGLSRGVVLLALGEVSCGRRVMRIY